MPVNFDECPESEMENVVEINVLATMRVTKIVLPNMLSKCVQLPSFLMCANIALSSQQQRLDPQHRLLRCPYLQSNAGSICRLQELPLCLVTSPRRRVCKEGNQSSATQHFLRRKSVLVSNTSPLRLSICHSSGLEPFQDQKGQLDDTHTKSIRQSCTFTHWLTVWCCRSSLRVNSLLEPCYYPMAC